MNRMRDRIFKERWQTQQAELSFSCKQVELSPLPGQVAEGSFEISCTDGMTAEGFVRADDERITCSVPWFLGSREQIGFLFDARDMEEGEVREGCFYITADCGEYRLPYRICIGEKVLQSSMGEIRNLFHFTNLARAYWQEAVKLFYHPEFIHIFDKENEALRNLYKGFSAQPGNEWNVEQFLVAVNKKQPISYSCTQTQIRVADLHGQVREEITVNRNGWGANGLTVTVTGDFITVEKSWLGEESFLGSQCTVPVFLNEEAMHAGRNFGKVEFSWPGGCLTVDIMAEQRNIRVRAKEQRRRQSRHCVLEMVRLYEQLRMKKMGLQQWQKDAAECLERMSHLMEKSPIPRLFKAHLLLTEDKTEEAGWILEHTESMMRDADVATQCYFLYLSTLYNKKEAYVLKVERKVWEIYAQNPQEWRIAWLLLFLSKEINKTAAGKWAFLEECFVRGCTSPVLYLEALQLLNANPALLPKPEGYVLRILIYGARKKLLTPDLVGQIQYLTGREKYFDIHLYEILRLCYEANPDDDTLQAICALLIKGSKTGTEYYSWYLKGVEKKLRVTRIYEHYMMSLDLKKETEIPRAVLLYFAYQSDLDYEYAAYLYAYVEKYLKEDKELYSVYRPQIEQFVTVQLQKGRVSQHLAYLYEQYVQGEMLNGENAASLAALLPKAEVEWNKDKCCLVVVHARMKGEERYALSRQMACVDLYSDSDILFLQEENGNRRLADGQVSVRRLFTGEQLRKRLAPQDCTVYSLLCVDGDGVYINEENVGEYRTLLKHQGLDEGFARKVRGALVKYYFEQDLTDALDEILEQSSREQISLSDRAECARILILRGFYRKAYQWLEGTDTAKQDARILMRMCSGLLEEGTEIQEKRLTRLCAQAAIQGKYDERILKQLVSGYEGSIRELDVIYQAADGFGMETFGLCERLIEQMLYTGADVSERTDLLRQYVREGGSSQLVSAFVHHCACRYVMQDEPIHTYMIQLIAQLMRQKENVSGMCEIAFLEYYSRNKDARTAETERLICLIGEKMYRSGRLLPVLKEYRDILLQAVWLEDKSFVVFRGQREEEAWIHYRYVLSMEQGTDYVSKPMRHIYGGIYSAEFLLFAGETLQYYITWGAQDNQIAENGFLKPASAEENQRSSRYAMLSAVSARQLERKDGSSAQLLQEYLHTDFLTAGLFEPI